MTLQPIKDVSEYKRLKLTLRDRFESEKTGDQSLLEEQTKKYKPLLSSQQEISKTMRDVANQIVESQNEGQAALQPLLPLLQNIQRAQVAAPRLLPPLPTAITPSNYATPQSFIAGQDAKSHIPLPVAPSSSRRDPIKVDLDDGFDRQDVDNLVELKLPLPSEVYETDTIPQTLDKIKTYNKSIGQFLGIGISSKKISNAKKVQLESQRDTLKKYRDRLENTESAKNLVAPVKSGKSGKGIPEANKAIHEISFYSSVDDLCNRLALLCAAKQAGNNGLNNNINSILDELLRINAIDKNEYNHLYSNIFN
mgnify:FL=1